MSILPIIFFGLGLSTAEPAPLALEDPAIVGAHFEVPVHAPAAALARAEIHREGRRVVVFIPGVRATPSERVFQQGPVQRLRVGAARRGTPVTLRLRDAATAESVRLSSGPHAALLVDGVLGSLRAAALPAALPAAPVPVEPDTPSRDTSPFNVADAPDRDAPEVAEEEEEEEAAPRRATALGLPTSPGRPVTTSLVLGLLLVGLAALGWTWRRARRRSPAAPADRIDILAVRGLGHKQRLALIDTCGERFLLASSEKEVRVLGHLGHLGHETRSRFDEVLGAAAELEGAEARPRRDPGTAALGEEEGPESAAAAPDGDLAGLLRLRRAKAPAAVRFPLRALSRDDDGVAA